MSRSGRARAGPSSARSARHRGPRPRRDRGVPVQPPARPRERGRGGQRRVPQGSRRSRSRCAPPLPEPDAVPEALTFDIDGLGDVRRHVAGFAVGAGLEEERCEDLVVAVHEVAANSVRHAGGRGVLRTWNDGGGVTCEVRDPGHIVDPLAGSAAASQPGPGRERPVARQPAVRSRGPRHSSTTRPNSAGSRGGRR